jgi:hypothetical protein
MVQVNCWTKSGSTIRGVSVRVIVQYGFDTETWRFFDVTWGLVNDADAHVLIGAGGSVTVNGKRDVARFAPSSKLRSVAYLTDDKLAEASALRLEQLRQGREADA